MPAFSKLSDWRVLGVSGLALLSAAGIYGYNRAQREMRARVSLASPEKKVARERVAVDGVFVGRIIKLLKICIPSVVCPETFFILMVAVFMILRTYCDLWMIRISTTLESVIVSRNPTRFVSGLMQFMLAMLPIAIVNNILKYGLEELVLRFRARLTKHLLHQYLQGFTYYKINNLDNRISNPDQLLTQDLDKFCRSVVDLYSNVSKPILDIAIYAYKLTGAIGIQGPTSMLSYLVLSGFVLTALRKPTGRFTVHEQRLEGEYRYVNSRLITNSEEIAFYQGNEREKLVLDSSFGRLVSMLRRSMQFRFSMGIIDHIIGKYFATTVGFYIVSRPFMDMNNPKLKSLSHAEIMEEYYRSGRMLLNLAQGVGRLVLAGRELTRLAGFTARMDAFTTVLSDLNKGKYERTMVRQSCPDLAKSRDLLPNSGKIVEVDHFIKFDKVPLVTPNGDVLVSELSFEVKSGINVLVCGPNGCGKSSLFRILGELWPLFGGELHKPKKEHLFYVPQRPYMTLGTLRDQIIYPHSKSDLERRGLSDDVLFQYLDMVHLSYLAQREGGWDSVADWMDVLSGGEKQRVAMARLFYNRPQFAILDECTSAVSVDVEGFMYNKCRELGITLFTVSHRKSLWEHHEYVLQFDGQGNYDFKPIKEATQFGS